MKKNLLLMIMITCTFAFSACAGSWTPPDESLFPVHDGSTGDETAEATTQPNVDADIILVGGSSPYWQAIYGGAKQAAADLDVEVEFIQSEDNANGPSDALQNAIAKKPKALVLSAADSTAVLDGLEQAHAETIPVIGFGNGVPGVAAGAILATATSDNIAAATLAAEELVKNADFTSALESASSPAVIGILSQSGSDADAERTQGFSDTILQYLEEIFPGAVTIAEMDVISTTSQSNDADEESVETGEAESGEPSETGAAETSSLSQDAAVVIQIFDTNQVSQLLNTPNLVGIFCASEDAANALLDVTNEGADLANQTLFVVGFNSGSAQKKAIQQGWFIGAVTQDLHRMGYAAVELAVKTIHGESVENIDTGALWYTSANMDYPAISSSLHD